MILWVHLFPHKFVWFLGSHEISFATQEPRIKTPAPTSPKADVCKCLGYKKNTKAAMNCNVLSHSQECECHEFTVCFVHFIWTACPVNPGCRTAAFGLAHTWQSGATRVKWRAVFHNEFLWVAHCLQLVSKKVNCRLAKWLLTMMTKYKLPTKNIHT